MLRHKTSLNKFNKFEIISSIFSDHKGLKLEINKKYTRHGLNDILKTMNRLPFKDGGNIGESSVHFPSTPGKYLAALRSRANSQQYSSIYEDQKPKIEDIERSDGKKSA